MANQGFYGNYSTAMLTWQSVESALYAVFFSMFEGPSNMQKVAAVYYSQESFGAKLRVVEAVAKVSLNADQRVEWRLLVKRMIEAAAERNVLAHFTAVADFKEGSDLGDFNLVLAPPIFVPPELRKARMKKYDSQACEDLIDEFSQLAEDLRLFSRR